MEFEVDFHGFVGAFHEDGRVDSFGFELGEEVDQHFECVSRVVDVFNYEDILAGVVLWFEFGLHLQFACGIGALVGFGPDEVVGVLVEDEFDEVGIEHEGSFEDANNHKFEVFLLLADVVVVLVDLPGQSTDNLFDMFPTVEKLELQSSVGKS